MDKSIREYIKENFKGSTTNDIKQSIESSINEKDEVLLPGLGVLLETVWSNSNEELKSQLLDILTKNL